MTRHLLIALLALPGCDDGGGDTAEPDAAAPVTQPPRPQTRWTTTSVATGGVGLHPTLSARGESVAAAWFSATGEVEGPCAELGDGAPDKIRWRIEVAERGAAGWIVEQAAAPILLGDPLGLALAHAPDGDLTLAVPLGEPAVMARYCGAHDLGLLSRSTGWGASVVVRESNQAAAGQPASDFGTVVNHWPALAYGPDGEAVVAWKDVHSGSIQRDDLARADLEIARGGPGGWAYSVVDVGRGHGDQTALAFDPEGRLLIVDQNPVDETEGRLGLWARRETAAGFEEVRLWDTPSRGRPGLAVDGEAVLVSFYDATAGRPMLARLGDPAAFTDLGAWTLEAVGDPRFDEGYGAKVAVSPQGFVAMAWYRCGRISDGLGACSAQHDGAIFAWQAEGEWMHEIIEEGDEAPCGQDPQLAFDGAGQAVVIWRCSRAFGDGFAFAVEAGTREPLR